VADGRGEPVLCRVQQEVHHRNLRRVGHDPHAGDIAEDGRDGAGVAEMGGHQRQPTLRAARHQTLIALLAVTGCRPGELLALDRRDVDLTHGRIRVRAGKQSKQREIPLHESTVSALRAYAAQRDAACPSPSAPAFFLSARGRRMGREELNRTFTTLIGQAELEGRGSRPRPRPYDLRHSFAVHTLLDWYRAGEDVDRRMPLLSTFMGHTDPASTYWYLETVPELLELVSLRLEQFPGILP